MQRIKKTWILLALLVFFTGIYPGDTAYAAATVKVQAKNPMVIVLDPGHGGYDGGACRIWGKKKYYEKNLNLSIALACKRELEKYSGVKVYLTRIGDKYLSLDKRVSVAKQKKADLLVCLHNNAAESSRIRGACVYYPNSGWDAEIGKDGKDLARCIQNRLVKSCGIKNNGTMYRNSANRSRYFDKSIADYYQVIKGSKLAGFPAVIVEHAYVSNPEDCKQFLGSADKLRKLGVADAMGIADYLGLVKNTDPAFTSVTLGEDGTVKLCWEPGLYYQKQILYRRESGQTGYTKMAVIEDPEVQEYVDTSVAPGVTYEYLLASYYNGKHGFSYTGLTDAAELMIPAQQTGEGETENPEDSDNSQNTQGETLQEPDNQNSQKGNLTQVGTLQAENS